MFQMVEINGMTAGSGGYITEGNILTFVKKRQRPPWPRAATLPQFPVTGSTKAVVAGHAGIRVD
jgi:hypothetical protein